LKKRDNNGSKANASSRKKATLTKENTKTIKKNTNTSPFDDTYMADIIDFLGEEHDGIDLPPLRMINSGPTLSHRSILLMDDAGAASSLLAMKTGLTPAKEEANNKNELKWSYSPANAENKENVAPMTLNATRSSRLNSSNVTMSTATPARKFTYPPPPAIKYSMAGTPSEVVQAQFKKVKANDIFSSSFAGKQRSDSTPSSTIPLDSLPLCDSMPMKCTPVNSNWSQPRAITTSTLKTSPFIIENTGEPLPFAETPNIVFDPYLLRTAEILQNSSSKDSPSTLPCHSPVTNSTPRGAFAV
jgi:hypothetical protein